MKKFILIFLLVYISACSSNPKSFLRSPSAIVKNIKSLEGKTVDDAIKKLGLPKFEQTIAGRKILVWFKADQSTSTLAQTYYSSDGSLNIVALSRKFSCVVRGIVSNDTIVQIEIEANSVYYCPGQRK